MQFQELGSEKYLKPTMSCMQDMFVLIKYQAALYRPIDSR